MSSETPLTIHEHAIDRVTDHSADPSWQGRDTYQGWVAMRFSAKDPVSVDLARYVLKQWLRRHYHAPVLLTLEPSPNGDFLKFTFDASGAKPDLSEQYETHLDDPRRV